MPEYTMTCPNRHYATIEQPMITTDVVFCGVCGEAMWRKPQPVSINWNGLRPSQGELHPDVRELIDTQDQRQDAFQATHEDHERRTDG